MGMKKLCDIPTCTTWFDVQKPPWERYCETHREKETAFPCTVCGGKNAPNLCFHEYYCDPCWQDTPTDDIADPYIKEESTSPMYGSGHFGPCDTPVAASCPPGLAAWLPEDDGFIGCGIIPHEQSLEVKMYELIKDLQKKGFIS
jgi:hypothetical protein